MEEGAGDGAEEEEVEGTESGGRGEAAETAVFDPEGAG